MTYIVFKIWYGEKLPYIVLPNGSVAFPVKGVR